MASITITTAGGQDAEIAQDVGEILGLAGSASAAQIKAMIIADFKLKIKNHRTNKSVAIAVASVTEPTVT